MKTKSCYNYCVNYHIAEENGHNGRFISKKCLLIIRKSADLQKLHVTFCQVFI